MKYKRLVSIGGHHLDAELMGGPLLIKYAMQGAHSTFINVTEGRLEGDNVSDTEKQAYLDTIRKENRLVAKAMGCDCFNMGYTSQTIPEKGDFIKIIKEYLKKEEVDLVVTHWRGTMHQRHYFTYETITKAVLELREEGYQIQLLYGENCEDLIGFIPTSYSTLEKEVVDVWFKALKLYTIFNGQINTVPYQEYYSAQLKVRAIEGGSKLPVKAYMHAPLFNNE